MVEIEVLSVCLKILVEEEGQPRLKPWLSLFRHKNLKAHTQNFGRDQSRANSKEHEMEV